MALDDELRQGTDRVRGELNRIRLVLLELTGLPSNWSGNVHLLAQAGFKGQKPFNCDIMLDAELVSQDIRWRTLLHESLHALSVGYNRNDFQFFRGWEEGVVERLQRLLRPIVLARLGIVIDENIFLPAEERHLYNDYIEALESLRRLTDLPEQQFYLDLLRAPIKNRPGVIFKVASSMAGEQRNQFLMALSQADAILKGDTRWNLQALRKNTGNGSLG